MRLWAFACTYVCFALGASIKGLHIESWTTFYKNLRKRLKKTESQSIRKSGKGVAGMPFQYKIDQNP